MLRIYYYDSRSRSDTSDTTVQYSTGRWHVARPYPTINTILIINILNINIKINIILTRRMRILQYLIRRIQGIDWRVGNRFVLYRG